MSISKRDSRPGLSYNVQRLATNDYKIWLVNNLNEKIKAIITLIAKSKESAEKKEDFANTLLFIMNILDIEEERLDFEKIKQSAKTHGDNNQVPRAK